MSDGESGTERRSQRRDERCEAGEMMSVPLLIHGGGDDSDCSEFEIHRPPQMGEEGDEVHVISRVTNTE